MKLYLPTAKEQDAITINTVRQEPKTAEAAQRQQSKMTDPGEKTLRTHHGKEIELKANAIVFSAKQDTLHITIDENKGVTIKSDTDITLSAEENIVLEQLQKLELKAEQEIILTCRESSIILTEEQLGINSPQTSIEGHAQKEYPAIPSQFELQLAKAAEKKKESSLDKIQLGLDLAGMIPAVGIIPDLINAGISAVRRDWGNAGLCLLAAIPIIGAAAGAAKIGAQAFKSLTKPAKKAPIITKAVETTSRIKNGISKVSTKAISAMEDSAGTISNGIKGLVEDIKAGKFPSKPRALVNQSGSLDLRRGNRVTEGAGDVYKLSEFNIKHIPDEFANQVKYLSDKQLADKLGNTSFFNPN